MNGDQNNQGKNPQQRPNTQTTVPEHESFEHRGIVPDPHYTSEHPKHKKGN